MELDHEPGIVLYADADGVAGQVEYSRKHFSAAGMDRFVRTFLSFLHTMMSAPDTRIKDMPVS